MRPRASLMRLHASPCVPRASPCVPHASPRVPHASLCVPHESSKGYNIVAIFTYLNSIVLKSPFQTKCMSLPKKVTAIAILNLDVQVIQSDFDTDNVAMLILPLHLMSKIQC